jgi:hypothetical protein
MDTKALEEELKGFTGTEQYFKHWSGQVKYTDGIQYLAEQAGAYWLLDLIASYQKELSNKKFQVWTLKKSDDTAVITMREDDELPVIVRQEIPYTDFPLSLTIFCIDGVVLLPSEY